MDNYKAAWFKWWLPTFLLLIAGVLIYNQYLATKRHNLNAVDSMRLCGNLDGDNLEACVEAVRRQRISAPWHETR